MLPRSLGEAVGEFQRSAFYRQAFGPAFVDFYAAHRCSEHERYSASDARERGDGTRTGEWEHREYFDLH
jgi:glutamine synthetase